MSPHSDRNPWTWRENQKKYDSDIRNRGCYVSTLDDIGLWIDSKIRDSNAE